MKFVWNWNNFKGGESDDQYIGPKGSFADGENIEIQKYPMYCTLSNKLAAGATTYDGTITFIANLADYTGTTDSLIVCTSTGKIYLDGTLKHTLVTSNNDIIGISYNIVSGTPYLYYFTKTYSGTGYIHRSNTTLTSFTENHKTFAPQSSGSLYEKMSIIKSGSDILFTYKDTVFSLDNLETVTNELLIEKENEIIGMTVYQGLYRIYANSTGKNGRQYLWDGTSASPTYTVDWINTPFRAIANDGAYDYAVTGYNSSYSDLYMIAGTQKQLLKANLETASSSRRFNNYISIREGIVYISGYKVSGNDGSVYTYGEYYPGFGKALLRQYNNGTDNKILMHTHGVSTSYFACEDSKVYIIEHNNPPSVTGFATSGFIISQQYTGQGYSLDKSLISFDVGYSLESGSIDIYLSVNQGTFKLIKSITDTTKKREKIYTEQFKSQGFGIFNEMQIKVVLTAGVTGNPKLYGITTIYDDNLKPQ